MRNPDMWKFYLKISEPSTRMTTEKEINDN